VRVAHIEAGLRTNNKQQPWPEEVNRRLVSVVADRHYAPTDMAKENLLREGHSDESIVVTGNTVLDALLTISERLERDAGLRAQLEEKFAWLSKDRRTILVTGHRRESFGEGFSNICSALSQLARRRDVQIVYPVHLNPNVREPVTQMLSGLANIHLIEPVDYVSLVFLLKTCHFVLTDSGGIQEEAPSLGKPVLVMRATSERMEAVHAGLAKVVGVDAAVICVQAERLLDDAQAYDAMRNRPNPFGDGRAAARIIADLISQGSRS
jgi:UDP-N-acetylglucosamine 2-epimerase (non-hydrolysing)